jgi:uncharacterized repeat protein (TIGR01451 family)
MTPASKSMFRRILMRATGLILTTFIAATSFPAVAATFMVSVVTDSPGLGPLGSLRRAVNDANTSAGPDIIQFSLPANSTITLTAGRLTVSDSVLVDGTTTTNLTVSGGWNNVDNNTVGSRIFLTPGTFTGTLEIRRMTLTNGNAGAGSNLGLGLCLDGPPTSPNGGALCLGNGTTILDQVRIVNSTGNDGGAIQLVNGTLEIRRSTFEANLARDDAGAIQVDNGTVTVVNSTFAGNSAGFGTSGAPPGTGGALRVDAGSVAFDHVTVTFSTADQFGAIDARPGTTINIANSLFVANNATQAGQQDGCGGGGTIAASNSWANNDPAASATPGNATCASVGNGDSAANIALSTTLAANGGVTPTLALGIASTMRGRLDKPCAQPADQRDVARGTAAGEDCEPGAYELNPADTDLAVTKTNGVTELAAASTTTYTLVVTNNGPASTDNARLSDVPVSGITLTAVSCVAAGDGAACPSPAQVTLANLTGGGIAIGTMPVGSTVTFSVTATVD